MRKCARAKKAKKILFGRKMIVFVVQILLSGGCCVPLRVFLGRQCPACVLVSVVSRTGRAEVFLPGGKSVCQGMAQINKQQ